MMVRAVCEALESRRLLTVPAPLFSAYAPQAFQAAYGANDISFGGVTGDGAGQTIAIMEVGSDPTAYSDLQAFDTYFGLPDPPSFNRYDEHGGTNYPGASGSVEEALDIEWAHVMAPDASIDVVECSNYTGADFFTAGITTAASLPGVSVVSISLGANYLTGYDSVFTTPSGHNPVTFCAASGDSGAALNNNAPTSYPASCPSVVAVGGTDLTAESSGIVVSDTAWSGSGGGICSYEQQPYYQASKINNLSSTQRTVPDLAMDAGGELYVPGGTTREGVYVYDATVNGTEVPWCAADGTGLACPLFAGLVAIADQGRAVAGLPTLSSETQTLQRLYMAPSSDFNDITSGTTATSANGESGYSAGPGYDLATGLGSPIGNLLVPDLAFGFSDFLVTNTNDSGVGSLRQAISDANAYGRPTSITFDIPTSDPNYANGVFTIKPKSQLPTITDAHLTLDGNTQETYTGSTNGGRPVIFLVGSVLAADGLVVSASSVTIENLGVDSFPGTISGGGGIVLNGNDAEYDYVEGCLIGVGTNGTSAAGNAQGVVLSGGAYVDYIGTSSGTGNVIGDNTIGVAITNAGGCQIADDDIGLTAALSSAPNETGVDIYNSGINQGDSVVNDVIGDNTGNGVVISGSNSQLDNVQGCDIGVSYSSGIGYFAAGNGGDGILLNDGATDNSVGGINTGGSNVIAGNSGDGIEFDDASGNAVLANTIGLASHSIPVGHTLVTTYNPNLGAGVYIHDGAASNQIGGTTTNNIISDDSEQGVLFGSDAGTGNSVVDDYIGTDPVGDSVGNLNEGILLFSNGETVSGNVISGNGYSGMSIIGNSNGVTGNYIGLNPAGTAALPNLHEGIYLSGNTNTISGNFISGNDYTGISVVGSFGNTISSNYIGLDHSGTAAIPNQQDGIGVTGTSNTILNDVVSGNVENGVNLQGGSNTVSGCDIGTNAAGTAAIPNQENGVLVGSASNTISGDVLSGNGQSGVALEAGNNTVIGCNIGTDAAGSVAIPNEIGIYLSGSGNVIGGTTVASRNVISGNTAGSYGDGVFFDGPAASSDIVEGNYIGLNAAGTAAVPNLNGVYLRQGAANNTIGSLTAGGGNIISGNSDCGISITTNSTGTTVIGNFIGTNPAGTAAIGNLEQGIDISAPGNTIGGMYTASRNVISGNPNGSGVYIETASSSGDTVEGNYVGTNSAGTAAVPNSSGIEITTGASGDTILNDVISGNSNAGVQMLGNSSTGSVVVGSLIGTDYTGTQPLGNKGVGIYVSGDSTQIGQYAGGRADGNTIDYNGNAGIEIAGSNGAYVVGTTLYNNSGGGIYNEGTLNIYNSTIAGNRAIFGAGIYNSGTLVVNDATIVQNTANGSTGAIFVSGGTITLQDDIIARNTGGDITGAISASSTYNLIGDGTGLTGITNGSGHNQVGTRASPIDPQLLPLTNNGGPTATFALNSSSPALNAGIGISSISTDQRGYARPTSGAVDIGAVQHQGNAVSISGAAVYLRLDSTGQTLDVYLNNTGTGTPSQTYLVSGISSLAVTGTAGNDELTVDYSNGNPAPSGVGISYDGLGGANTLEVIGTAGNDVIAVTSTAVSVGSSTITYADVQQRIVDPLAGTDSLSIASGVYVYLPPAPTGGGVLTRKLSSLTLGTNAVLAVRTSPNRSSDRTLLVVQALTINTGATLDLGGNDADFSGVALSTVTNLLTSGYNGGTWIGTGINSSYASGIHLTALGAIQNNQGGTPLFGSSRLFDGTAPGASDVLVKYTYYGDANLDGKVDGSDYSRIDNGALNHLTGWFNGDFNYDGVINGSDYTLIDNAYNTQGASLAAQVANALPVANASQSAATPRLVSATNLFSDAPISDDLRKRDQRSLVVDVGLTLGVQMI